MSEARFNIVFHGELVPGADTDTVKANLARVFKMDAARVEKLFGSGSVVLKKDADQATAMKFRAVLKKAGAQCEMRPVGEPAAQAATERAGNTSQAGRASFEARDPQSQSLSDQAAEAQRQRQQAQASESGSAPPGVGDEVEEIEAAPPPEPAPASAPAANKDSAPPPDSDLVGTIRMGGTGFSGEFDVAPAGADMADEKVAEQTVNPDISHLSLAPPGTDLEQLPGEKPVPAPDISHLSLVPEEDK